MRLFRTIFFALILASAASCSKSTYHHGEGGDPAKCPYMKKHACEHCEKCNKCSKCSKCKKGECTKCDKCMKGECPMKKSGDACPMKKSGEACPMMEKGECGAGSDKCSSGHSKME